MRGEAVRLTDLHLRPVHSASARPVQILPCHSCTTPFLPTPSPWAGPKHNVHCQWESQHVLPFILQQIVEVVSDRRHHFIPQSNLHCVRRASPLQAEDMRPWT